MEDNLKALIKPQYVDHIPRAIKGNQTVSQMLDSKLERDNKEHMCDVLELNEVLTREVSQLSGGELQRFAIAMSCIQQANVCVLLVSVVYKGCSCLATVTCSMSLQVTWISSSG